jgi:hypothetical protein
LISFDFLDIFMIAQTDGAPPARHEGIKGRKANMVGRLDWKWIGIGVLIMAGLSIVAGMVITLFMRPTLQGVTDVTQIELTSGQIMAMALVNILVFLIGGFIVGIKSAGRTIIEPGLSAAIAVAIALLISGNFSISSLLAAGLVPFVAGIAGGWLGERRQSAA